MTEITVIYHKKYLESRLALFSLPYKVSISDDADVLIVSSNPSLTLYSHEKYDDCFSINESLPDGEYRTVEFHIAGFELAVEKLILRLVKIRLSQLEAT